MKEYLVNKFNVDPNRIEIADYGESRPIDDNNTKEGRCANRRVEFVFINLYELK